MAASNPPTGPNGCKPSKTTDRESIANAKTCFSQRISVPWPQHPLLAEKLVAGVGERRPNVLFIITDQQFADAMSCRMGKQYLNTPAMDRPGADGMLFTRAYSSNPLCMPLRNSVFTGRYPHETGVTPNARPQGGLDPKEFVCMGTYFRNAGYDTAYSGKWHLCFNAERSRAHGFEIVTGQVKATTTPASPTARHSSSPGRTTSPSCWWPVS